MAVTPTYPGVYIEELPSAVHPITGVATSIGAFVGYTARGIDHESVDVLLCNFFGAAAFTNIEDLRGADDLQNWLGY